MEPGRTDLIISKIEEANAELRNITPSPQLRDTTAPQVVMTWPLGGWLACDQLVYAVASDNSGTVSEVKLLVHGELEAVISEPPYRFSVNTAQLGFGEQRITAKAYDGSGNVRQDAVTARAGLCLRERLFRLLEDL
jgi:hypothetical protein